MPIYRGPGGASETTDQATITAVQTAAAQAASSATAAASSATTASNNASAAASSASTASGHASTAAGYVTSAANQAAAAVLSAAEAEGFATDAEGSAEEAASSASAASGHATEANDHMNNAETYMDRAEAAAEAASGYVTDASDYADAAAASAVEAAGYVNTAADSASEASDYADAAAASAVEAAGYVTDASGYADDASDSASSSANSASAAAASADAALAALDSFDDRYLGQKSVEPTVDNDGNPLVAGALYFNTVDNAMKVYDGTQWLAAYASLSGALIATNNLSDLVSVSSARTNLGLGTAATTNSTAYATAAQGALADTALQPAAIGVSVQGYNANTVVDSSYVHTDNNYTTTEKSKLAGIADGAEVNVNADWNASSGDAQILNKPTLAAVATSGSYTDLSNKPTLGTAAATDSTAYATAAQGTKADTAYGWGNHASAGYLTSYTETDPIYVASSWYTTTNNAANWNTAYGWGNHASAGYAASNGSNASGTWNIAISGNAATATSAGNLSSTNWVVEESGGVLYFKYGGTNKAKLDSSGNLTVVGNVTAYGSV